MLNNNRGMFAEEIINRTILFYENNVDIYIEKREIPIKIVSKKDNGYIVGKLLRKSFVDYFGVYKNKHFEFEVKQTEKEYFDIALLKNHQISHLVDMEKRNIKTFIIVYSSIENKFYILKTSWLNSYLNMNNKKKIAFDVLKENCLSIDIVYPGIIDFNNICECIYT